MRQPRPDSARFARLLLTPLEDRTAPAAGLAVSFSGGILRVTDWRPGDAVAVHQTTGGVTLDSGAGSQSFAGVSRVLLDVQSDARVTNDVSGLTGVSPRSVYLSRRDPTGKTFTATGPLAPGATSGPQTPTSPQPPPGTPPTSPKSDWFDAAVTDATLRTLVRSLAVDGSLGRADWLQLFAEVGADGSVSAAEYHDLGDLLHTNRVTSSAAVGFTLPDAVRVLADKVVDGNPANARYGGAALGNLHAGSAAGQLQRLVGKWFLGTDRPQAAAGTTYRVVGGALFVNGAAYADVRQGQVGDCYFVAALAEVARFSPQVIQQMFTDNGDGTFTVRFFHNGTADYVTVDRALPTTAAGTAEYASFGGRYDAAGNELWVALAEKAYAQLNEAGWLGHAASNSYAAIDGGYADLALEQVTGRGAGWKWVQNATPADLIAAATSGKYTVLGSKQTAPGNGVLASHGYALAGYNSATGRFTLYNPWGSTIQLTWQQIAQSFNGFWQAGL